MRASIPFAIADLRERPEFSSSVADRVWRAWWEPKGYGLGVVEDLVRDNLDAGAIPFALVAHDRTGFVGTASVIASDLDIRPHYTPWVAAVWVEPAHRDRGIGSALVRRGVEAALRLGFDRAYLCALPPRHDFYMRRGWRILEANVTPDGLAVFQSP